MREDSGSPDGNQMTVTLNDNDDSYVIPKNCRFDMCGIKLLVISIGNAEN